MYDPTVDALACSSPKAVLYMPCIVQGVCIGTLQLTNKLSGGNLNSEKKQKRASLEERHIYPQFSDADCILASVFCAQFGSCLSAVQSQQRHAAREALMGRLLDSSARLRTAVLGDGGLRCAAVCAATAGSSATTAATTATSAATAGANSSITGGGSSNSGGSSSSGSGSSVDPLFVVAQLEELGRATLRARVKVFIVQASASYYHRVYTQSLKLLCYCTLR
jgi:hypothetical protein